MCLVSWCSNAYSDSILVLLLYICIFEFVEFQFSIYLFIYFIFETNSLDTQNVAS